MRAMLNLRLSGRMPPRCKCKLHLTASTIYVENAKLSITTSCMNYGLVSQVVADSRLREMFHDLCGSLSDGRAATIISQA